MIYPVTFTSVPMERSEIGSWWEKGGVRVMLPGKKSFRRFKVS